MNIRKRLSDSEAMKLDLPIGKRTPNTYGNPKYRITPEQWAEVKGWRGNKVNNKSKTKSNTYEKPFVLSAWNDSGYMMDIDQYCDHYKLPRKDIRSYKLVSHTGTPFYNIVFREMTIEKEIDFNFIDSIVQKHIKPVEIKLPEYEDNKSFTRVVYTDTHIGMTPNESGFSLYGGKWDEVELDNRLEIMCGNIIDNAVGSHLIIDDLGDLVDGWNGETVRKGHKLPQNMDNQKAFDVALSFKIKMIDLVADQFDKIEINNICEDNHSGAFGYVVNSAFKKVIEQRYAHVKVTNHRKFINHYYAGSHCFVISHGKDSHALKFGFKPHLDPKQVEKIDQYLKQNDIYKLSEFVEFSKGDSHQMLFDFCTSDDFDYFNYPAFSPSSEWVQTNFKKGRSGFVLQNIEYNGNNKEIKPYFF